MLSDFMLFTTEELTELLVGIGSVLIVVGFIGFLIGMYFLRKSLLAANEKPEPMQNSPLQQDAHHDTMSKESPVSVEEKHPPEPAISTPLKVVELRPYDETEFGDDAIDADETEFGDEAISADATETDESRNDDII